MPAPYSMDLRERVLAACERREMTEVQIAEAFSIGEATVRRWKRRNREAGTVEPLAHGGGHPAAVNEEGLLLLCQLVQEQPDATAQEVRDALVEQTEKSASRSAVVRAMKKLGLTRKKSR